MEKRMRVIKVRKNLCLTCQVKIATLSLNDLMFAVWNIPEIL